MPPEVERQNAGCAVRKESTDLGDKAVSPGRVTSATNGHALPPADSRPTVPEPTDSRVAPPDGGWGWAVLFGAMVVNIVVIGHAKSFGVYFTSVMERFDASPSRVAWVQAIQLSIFSFLGPVSSVLSQALGPRKVALVGGVLVCCGLALSSIAPNLEFLYFFYGVMQGIAVTCTFTPGIMMIGQYFHERRGLANGLGMAGNALGGIVMPLVADYLTTEYGLKGAWLIMGGILLHACVGAMFWQPVSWHLKPLLQEHATDTEEPTEEDDEVPAPVVRTRAHRTPQKRATSVDDVTMRKLLDQKALVVSEPRRMHRSSVDERLIPLTLWHQRKEEDRMVSVHSADTLPNLSSLTLRTGSLRKDHLTSSFVYLSTFDLEPPPGALLTKEHLLEETPEPPQKKSKKTQGPKKLFAFFCCKGKFLDVAVLKNWKFYILTWSMFFHFLGYPGTQIYLPVRATMLGLTKGHTASILSVLAFSDLLGRVCCAWLSDFHLCPRKYWFIGGLLMSGVCAFLLQFCDDYPSLLVGSGAFGFASGTYIGLVVALFADVFGGDKVALAYSMATVFGGFMGLGGPPMIGYVLEQTGSYRLCQTILGSAQFIGAASWLLEPWVVRREDRKRRLVAGDGGTFV